MQYKLLETLRPALLAVLLAGLATASVHAQIPGLKNQDVGAPTLVGSTTFAAGKYTIVGGGDDIWNTSDNFHFAYFEVTGDFDYVVKVEDLQGPDNWSKAELMAREADASALPQGGDRFLANMTTRAGGQNEVGLQWRSDMGTAISGFGSGCAWPNDIGIATPLYRPTYPNTWLRLRREGSKFYGFASTNGTDWTLLRGSPYDTGGLNGNEAAPRTDGAFTNKLLLGFAVTAHNDLDPTGATAVFSEFGAHVPIPVAIATQPPATLSVAENKPLVLTVEATGDPVKYEWRKGTPPAPIAGATAAAYRIDLVKMSDAGTYSVRVYGDVNEVISSNSVVTVTPDVEPPTVLGAKGLVGLTNVVLTFSERLNPTSAQTASNYQISTAGGAVNVTAAALSADELQVTLTTALQTVGVKHTVTVNNVTDPAGNPVAAGSKVAFFPVGRIVQDAQGLIVFEAENYSRNLDGLWVRDTTVGTPSGGVSMLIPNGAGGSETATQLEYDVEFTKTGTHYVWYRARADSGSDDSGWFWLDGARPAERITGNQASMTGFNVGVGADFVWRSDAQDPPDPFTVEVATAGPHVIGLARREDGAYFDKFLITTDAAYRPAGFGPPETREGAPGLPTVALSAPTDGQTFPAGTDVTLTATATGAMSLEIRKVVFLVDGNQVGEATASPFAFTWSSVPEGVYLLQATATDEIGGVGTSSSVVIKVGNPPPQALFVISSGNPPTVNASDGLIKSRLESRGYNVRVVGSDFDDVSMAKGKDLIVLSSTFGSGNVLDTYKNVTVPVIEWEQAIQDDMAMTIVGGSGDRGTTPGLTDIEIVDATHPMAAGLPAGVTTVVTAPAEFVWGQPAASAKIVAQLGGTANACIYGYDQGALLTDGTAAAARRTLFLMTDNVAAVFNDTGWKLFDAAIDWTSGITPAPPRPTLTVDRTPTGVTITFTGKLESADTLVGGTWTEETTAVSPLAVTPSAAQKFYRAKR